MTQLCTSANVAAAGSIIVRVAAAVMRRQFLHRLNWSAGIAIVAAAVATTVATAASTTTTGGDLLTSTASAQSNRVRQLWVKMG